jgi:uncharacterized protein (DUF924 family)
MPLPPSRHKLHLFGGDIWHWHTFAFVLAQHTTTQLEKEDTFFCYDYFKCAENIAAGEMPTHLKKGINSKVPSFGPQQ